MTTAKPSVLPCAVYTRKSSEDGLEQEFNSLDAQREACEAFILSQKAQGWKSVGAYDDGGFSGGNVERPALKKLLADVADGRVRIVVVYKVDRLTRSLADFAKLVELFDAHGVSFVSVTQQFNTTSSMGRLTLNVLLSFAQFEREVTGERIRDKIAASKRKGLWMGGIAPIGYVPNERTLAIDEPQAARVREIYRLYVELGCVRRLKAEVDRLGWITPERRTRRADAVGGRAFSRGHLYRVLTNRIYLGQIVHKGTVFSGQHPAIVETVLWDAAQERLAANLQGHRSRATAANPSLLTGLVFDERGNRLAPTHANKGARRYRYYVGQAPGAASGSATPLVRLPAQELEQAVIGSLVRFLGDDSRQIALMGNVEADVAQARLHHAGSVSEDLATMSSANMIELLAHMVERITVHSNRLEIAVRIGAIWPAGGPSATDQGVELIDTPVQLKRCGMAVRLIVSAPGATDGRVSAGKPDPTLVALVGKAQTWFDRLSSGHADSVLAIARELRIGSPYVARVIHLAFLAPDIVQRIARGDHPVELNADRLIRMVPLPMDWQAQRVLLGLIG
jgi:DNA invertase Pin-like site-specific DNA recombinase